MMFPFRTERKPAIDQPREGILLGFSGVTHQDPGTPEYLDPAALRYHSLVVGKASTGKTALLRLLAIAAMQHDRSLVVLDADGDLSPTLLEQIPPRRMDEVAYFDFSDTAHVIGLNPLDVATARYVDPIVGHIAHASELLWKGHWGPFQEDAFRTALHTLLHANQALVQRGQDQLTLLDLPALFELPSFRRRLLQEYVTDSALLLWWGGFYERLDPGRHAQATLPLLTQVRSWAQNPTLRSILGQPKSAINFRELLSERRILLINLAQRALPPVMREWLGSVLTGLLATAVFEQNRLLDAEEPKNLAVVLDGLEPVSILEGGITLSGLAKRGASVLVSFDSLTRIERVKPAFVSALIANINNLFVFRSTLRDAELLSAELGADVTITDLLELPDHACYARTQSGDRPSPGRLIWTVLPPSQDVVEIRDQILNRRKAYTVKANRIAERRRRFEEYWYGREAGLGRRDTFRGGDGNARREDSGHPDGKP